MLYIIAIEGSEPQGPLTERHSVTLCFPFAVGTIYIELRTEAAKDEAHSQKVSGTKGRGQKTGPRIKRALGIGTKRNADINPQSFPISNGRRKFKKERNPANVQF